MQLSIKTLLAACLMLFASGAIAQDEGSSGSPAAAPTDPGFSGYFDEEAFRQAAGTMNAGAIADPRVKAVALMAPHVFTEDLGIASIVEAKRAYEQGDLKRKLARWHDHVDCAFYGWNGAWLDPGFRAWNLEEFLPAIRVPMLVVQGEADQYGTIEQVRAIARGSGGPVETVLIPDTGHSPYREAPDAALAAISGFLARCEEMKNIAS